MNIFLTIISIIILIFLLMWFAGCIMNAVRYYSGKTDAVKPTNDWLWVLLSLGLGILTSYIL